MTFWKFLWQRCTNIIEDSNRSIDSSILIEDFKYENKRITIFISKDKNINLCSLEQLCDTVGWIRRPFKKVKIAIHQSFLTTSLFYRENNSNKLIAFARATSDNAFNATIWDVVVHPEFQKKGLGKILMNELIKELRFSNVNTITLFADPQVLNFYKNLGFISDPDGVKGMFWYPS